MSSRPCSKPGCGQPAAGTLSYTYAEKTAVLGPLGITHEPHCYDLCQRHLENLTVPTNWTMLFHRDFRHLNNPTSPEFSQ